MKREFWKPERKEIEDWFERQIQEFAVKENRSEKLTAERWKNRYILTESYEILVVTFVIELQEWIAKLVEFQKCWKDERVTQWTPEPLQQLEKTDNTITCMVDHQVDSALGGFVMEFSIDQFVSYSKDE